ncbi:MAG: aminoglycoside phosphotransferase family protein [Chromatiales bacterium]|nr:aminoglycoside phosphotransferase family protein [Chromatiales bacterium]
MTPIATPNDPALPHLAEMLDPAGATQRLRQSLGAPGLRVHAARLIRHKPGRRALVAYRIAPFGRLPERFLAKTRARGLDERTWRLTERLYNLGLISTGAYRASVPRPLGMVPEWRAWLQTWVPGEVVWDALLFDPPERATALAAGIAEALWALHRAPVEVDRRHDIDAELAILEPRLRQAAERHPAWSERIGSVLDACRTLTERVRARPVVNLHRDFYPDQILVAGDRLHLLDLDLCTRGDPALDLGNFVAHLEEHALRKPWIAPRAALAGDAFIARYREFDPDPGLPEAIAIHARLTLARHIRISTQFAERAPFTERILERCEHWLEGA